MKTIRKEFSSWNKWQRIKPSEKIEVLCKKVQVDEIWLYLGENSYCAEVRNIHCEFGKIKHLITSKLSGKNLLMRNYTNTEELDYSEKIWMRKNVLCGEIKDMIEIFPRESSLVDLANLYHLWVLPEDFQFPFPIEYPEERNYQESGYFYDINFGVKEIQSQYGKVVVLSICSKDGKRIPWKAKQEIKDDLIGKENTAVEIIGKDVKCMKEDECYMVGMPHRFKLPFGLAEGKERQC